MRFSLQQKIFTVLVLTFFSLAIGAKEIQKQALALKVSEALHDSDKEAFHTLLKPIINSYDTAALGLSKEESANFKEQLTASLSKYLFTTLLEARMEIYDENELKAMATLYTSPMGKSIAKKLPLIRDLQNVESADTAAAQILTKQELAFAKKFAASDVGKLISVKTKQVNELLLTKVKTDNALQNKVTQFSQEYLTQKKNHKE